MLGFVLRCYVARDEIIVEVGHDFCHVDKLCGLLMTKGSGSTEVGFNGLTGTVLNKCSL